MSEQQSLLSFSSPKSGQGAKKAPPSPSPSTATTPKSANLQRSPLRKENNPATRKREEEEDENKEPTPKRRKSITSSDEEEGGMSDGGDDDYKPEEDGAEAGGDNEEEEEEEGSTPEKIDRLRRLIVGANTQEAKRLIPKITITNHRDKGNDTVTMSFKDYCDKCKQYSDKVDLNFDKMICMGGRRRCKPCTKNSGLSISAHSEKYPVHSKSFEECYDLVTEGSQIEKLKLKEFISTKFVGEIGHVINSSQHLELKKCKFDSAELFMDLVKERRELTFHYNKGNEDLLTDEFFHNAGQGTLRVISAFHGPVNQRTEFMPITDKQLEIVAGREDLTDIRLDNVKGITRAGMIEAVKILLRSSPKSITMVNGANDTGDLEKIPELDAEPFIEEEGEMNEEFDYKHDCVKPHTYCSYSYGDVMVEMTAHDLHTEIEMTSH